MAKKTPTNIAASMHARLLKKAKADGRPFNELLQYFAMERFLYRLSRSKHADRFVLKGALMLQLWGGSAARATKDIDLLGRNTASPEELVAVIQECLAVEVADDGVVFDAPSVRGEDIRIDADYGGVRLTFTGKLGNARLSMQVDVGFGDAVTPAPVDIEYPTLLDLHAPKLLAYTPETSIAEKLHAMVVLDMANSRMKDFLDIWTLAQTREFSGPALAAAIKATFKRRNTLVPASLPVALTPAFFGNPQKQAQWQSYIRKARAVGPPRQLAEAVENINTLLVPILQVLADGRTVTGLWKAGGPWAWAPSAM